MLRETEVSQKTYSNLAHLTQGHSRYGIGPETVGQVIPSFWNACEVRKTYCYWPMGREDAMAIEMTGTIKSATEQITDVNSFLETECKYEIRLQLDLDHKTFLALKRLQLLREPVRVVLDAAQEEMALDAPWGGSNGR